MTALPLRLPTSMPDLPRWMPRALELALVLVLLALVARLGLHAFTPGPSALPMPPAADDGAAPAPIPAVDLFYRRSGEGATNAGSVDGLVLHGIRGGVRPSAILADGDGVQRAWAVGSEPAVGVVLAQVAGDHVALRRTDGTTVQLPLADRAPSSVRAPPRRRTDPAGSAATTAPTGRGTAPAGSAPPAAQAGPPPTPAAPAAPAGYRLGAEAERLPLRLAGLKPGDEILSINGQAVGDDPAALRERLAGQTRFELRYRREGRMHTATVGLP